MRFYKIGLSKADEPESKGGLSSAAKARLRKNIENGQAQLDGKMSRNRSMNAAPVGVQILSGSATRVDFAVDGSVRTSIMKPPADDLD